MQQPLSKKYPKSSSRATPPAQTVPDASGVSSLAGLVNPHPFNLTRMVEITSYWLKNSASSEALFSRTSAHLIVILLVALTLGVGSMQIQLGRISALRPFQQTTLIDPVAAAPSVDEETGAPLTLPSQLNDFLDDVLVSAAVPHTIVPERAREQISTYEVQSGDTIYGIAGKFGLDPETIMWSNPDLEKAPDLLSIGQQLTILPTNGVYHQVGEGDTLQGIADTFKVDPSAILNYSLNELDPDNPVITPGQWLVVPGGSKPFIPRTVVAYYTGEIPEGASEGTGTFAWPASGTIYQGFFPWHPAIDIAAYIGAPVLAGDSGYVIVAGWSDVGYGYHLVIDHGNGYQTLYAHLNSIYVNVGDNVAQGQQIGEMGNTGNATGPHLHFEIRQNTVVRNPIGILP
ncbi:MAG: M23 family metallopeptidase [Anaerolineales bacterium]|nr:M23 family metallopeptidase [Anaerolineales bacterium]